YLMLNQPATDIAALYTETTDGLVKADTLGRFKPFRDRHIDAPDYIFPIEIAPNSTKTYYMLVASNDQLQLPIFVGTPTGILEKNSTKGLLFGLYAGAVLIMIAYNLFLSISTKGDGYISY